MYKLCADISRKDDLDTPGSDLIMTCFLHIDYTIYSLRHLDFDLILGDAPKVKFGDVVIPLDIFFVVLQSVDIRTGHKGLSELIRKLLLSKTDI